MAICQRKIAVHKWSLKKNSIAKIVNCISFEIYIDKKVEVALYLNDRRLPNDEKKNHRKQTTNGKKLFEN